MALSNQTQVMANMDAMAGKAMGKVAKRYRKETIGPLVGALGKAKSPSDLLRRLNPALLRRMKSDALEGAATEVQVQAAMIGRTTAMPAEGRRRKDETV